jgi:hypothetical protein
MLDAGTEALSLRWERRTPKLRRRTTRRRLAETRPRMHLRLHKGMLGAYGRGRVGAAHMLTGSVPRGP